MSGGRLVVMDRLGRDVKTFPLASGAATLGSSRACDICMVQSPNVKSHHATVTVHKSQTVVRNVAGADGLTRVNGQSVRAAALRHGDVITLGDRNLRWEYSASSRRLQGGRGARRASAGPGSGVGAALRAQALQLAMEMTHRASMPASSGAKQVAIVQPQRRDTHQLTEAATSAASEARSSRGAADSAPPAPPAADAAKERRTRSPKDIPHNTTKATLWIESRKTSPRRKVQSGTQVGKAARRTLSAKKSTPLRLTVLKRAQSAHKPRVVKIEAPHKIDYTKQAAIMLMAKHTPRGRLGPPGAESAAKLTPSYVVKKPSPVRRSVASVRLSRRTARASPALATAPSPALATAPSPALATAPSPALATAPSPAGDVTGRNEVTILETSALSARVGSPRKSPALPSPRKSALKDHTKKSTRKTESIKFDLSNLESRDDDDDDEDNLTLCYSEDELSPSHSHSARHSRSSRMLESLGTTLTLSPSSARAPSLPSPRRSVRSSMLVRRALNEDTSVPSAYRTRTLSPRATTMDSYSVVDLVSIESDTTKSVYNSADGSGATDYGTPSATRRTRSTLEPALLGSSTPYAPRRPASASGKRSKSLATPQNRHISVNSSKMSRASRSRSRLHDTDLQLLDDTDVDDSSPRSSRRLRLDTSLADLQDSPERAATPVLSIQSLLDSSRTSIVSAKKSTNSSYKRVTIGALSEPKRRPPVRSKSVGGVPARRTVLRLSGDSASSERTEPGTAQSDTRDKVTPRSAVKLVPEAIKNRHSSEKKPHSKRSIIDDLDESDIVKQLFPAPVKRNLSRTMLEEASDLSDSDSFTPERFVSPLSTPRHSPDLSGIKRLFRGTSPDAPPTPAPGSNKKGSNRQSAKSDLTNVSGLKLIFAKSPRNRLSDVRVKSLFRRDGSPKNDLTDVRGVKKLFGKSPADDLRNVSGVKVTLRNSPRNNLTDVRGVRKMFRNEKRKAAHDVSGIEALFQSPATSNSESLFDRWLGKPALRSVYSKTFSAKLTNKPKNRRLKTLHKSLDEITDNVEEWLQKELQARLETHKCRDNSVSGKEMQKLATSTVAGGEPLRTSRTRNSSLAVRSASELYEAHTLPLKKRSLAGSKPPPNVHMPLKKRAVVHSTPVKGRPDLTMNASELGRVSPIHPDDTHKDNSHNRSSRRQGVSPSDAVLDTPARGTSPSVTPRSTAARGTPRGTSARETLRDTSTRGTAQRKTITAASLNTLPEMESPKKPSPQKSPPKKASLAKVADKSSPVKTVEKSPPRRSTRNRKNTTVDKNTKKRRASLVITKKAPVMSPDLETKTNNSRSRTARTSQTDVKQTRRIRRVAFAESPKESPPKKTRGKKKEPKAKENKDDIVTAEKPQSRRGRKAVETLYETPKKSPPSRTSAKQKEPKSKEDKKDIVPAEKPQARRGRKAVEAISETPKKSSPKRTRNMRNELKGGDDIVSKEKPQARRGRKVVEPESVPIKESAPKKSRGKQNEPKGKENKTANIPLDKPQAKRGRKAVETDPELIEPVKRARRGAKVTDALKVDKGKEIKPRGKSVAKADDAPEEKQRKPRGKKVEKQESTPTELTTRRGRNVPDSTLLQPKTRGKNAVETASNEQSKPKTRARRGKAAAETAPEPEIQSKGRKRKSQANDEVPAKIAKTESKSKATVSQNVKAETTARGRLKKVEEKPALVKPTRGKKAPEPKETPPVANKRKNTIKASPVKASAASTSRARRR